VSGALVVRGEAGIGKSALLGYVVQRAAPGRRPPISRDGRRWPQGGAARVALRRHRPDVAG